MARRSSVFTKTKQAYVTLSIKVPQRLKDRIDGLKESLAAIDGSLTFNVAKICQDALEASVKQGEGELTQLRSPAHSRAQDGASAGGDSKRA